ncbi:MAG: hypothetical protein ACLRHW_20590 [Coprobacillus cateniformis]
MDSVKMVIDESLKGNIKKVIQYNCDCRSHQPLIMGSNGIKKVNENKPEGFDSISLEKEEPKYFLLHGKSMIVKKYTYILIYNQ